MLQQKNNNNSGTSCVQSACAACKHQRKKCSEECKLAGYFPADRNRQFQAVHKVFGVSNVTKIVHTVDNEESRQKIVDSLIWEAFWRQKDPVLGPYGEYKRVCEELKRCRRQTLMQSHNQNQLVQLPGQGEMIYRSSTPPPLHALIGWNGGMSMDGVINNNNNALNYSHDTGNSNVEMDNYGYPNSYDFVQSPKNLKQEREVGPVVIPQQQRQQQHSGFSQQYYLPGQFN